MMDITLHNQKQLSDFHIFLKLDRKHKLPQQKYDHY